MYPSFLIIAADIPDVVHTWDSPGLMLLKVTAVLFLVLLNAFFVAAEFAIVKVRSSQLEAIEGGGKGAGRLRIAMRVTEKLDAYLSATQLGITLASLGLGFLGKPIVSQLISPFFFLIGVRSEAVIGGVSFALAYAVLTFLHIVLGELAPKSLAIRKPVPTTLWVSAPLHAFYVILAPAIWFLNGSANLFLKHVMRIDPISDTELAHSAEELRVIFSESAKSKDVSPVGREILMNALDLRELVVRDIMTPRGEVVYLDVDEPLPANLTTAVDCRHTRFPLCRGHMDNTLGVIHIKDLVANNVKHEPGSLLTIKREALFVPEMMTLEKLLTFFLARHAHLAIVVDEYGGTVGIVTLDNVLAEIVGDIQDEFDVAETGFRRLNPDEFVAEGTLGLYELQDHAGMELDSPDVSTIGGYVTHLLGHLPRLGESVRIQGYEVTVSQTDGRRVRQVHFKRLPEDAAEDEEDRAMEPSEGSGH